MNFFFSKLYPLVGWVRLLVGLFAAWYGLNGESTLENAFITLAGVLLVASAVIELRKQYTK